MPIRSQIRSQIHSKYGDQASTAWASMHPSRPRQTASWLGCFVQMATHSDQDLTAAALAELAASQPYSDMASASCSNRNHSCLSSTCNASNGSLRLGRVAVYGEGSQGSNNPNCQWTQISIVSFLHIRPTENAALPSFRICSTAWGRVRNLGTSFSLIANIATCDRQGGRDNAVP